MKLFINGFQIELPPNVKIAKTIQANDIASVNTRQASYTNSFDIPLTSSNIKALEMLSIEGNNSNIPYQKNSAYLFSDSGEAIVNNGWAVINETGNGFKCNLYDGIIDLYKAIQNFTLADLEISDLQHDKTPAEVLSTQTLTKPYAYILADYNGKAMVGTNINSDYLVPAVKVSWLMDKIELFSGYTFSGSYKTNPDYTNLFLTTPKATPPVITGTILTDSNPTPTNTNLTNTPSTVVQFSTGTVITGSKIQIDPFDSTKIIANENVKIKVTFELFPLVENAETGGYSNANINNFGMYCDGSFVSATANYSLLQGESISFEMIFSNLQDPSFGDVIISDFFQSVTIQEFTNDSLFEQELGGLKITDFLNEIVWRFNLTLFKTDSGYVFKYLSEIINATPIDWSDKFINKDSETYVYGNYGQVNDFNLRYDDDNAKFNNGQIEINNTNLPATTIAVKSISYSPEFNPTTNLPFSSRVYKFWDKEVQDNGTVKYKTLSNRYFFIKPEPITLSTNLESPVLSSVLPITTAIREDFLNLDYKAIVQNYYPDMSALLNKSKVINVQFRLTDHDIATIDLSKPVYVKQLGGSYLINKISNFIPYQNTKVELIKINK